MKRGYRNGYKGRGRGIRLDGRYCYRCDEMVKGRATRCSCGSNAFYRGTSPRSQSVALLMDTLPEVPFDPFADLPAIPARSHFVALGVGSGIRLRRHR